MAGPCKQERRRYPTATHDNKADSPFPPIHDSIWQPLAKNQTRLLKVRAGRNSLYGTLHTVDINHPPSYDALSYCWEDDISQVISVDGYYVPISNSLYAAILHASTWRPCTLWIDALCINQRDLIERNTQVSMMGDIYRKAKAVRAWLPYDCYDDSIEHRFLSHRWWTRAWTLQEAVLARRLIFCGGKSTRSIEDLGCYCSSLNSDTEESQRYAALVRLRARPVSLLEAVAAGIAREARDPRDKIYAFIGLAQENLPVRYDASVEECCISFATNVISQTGRLEILKYAGSQRLQLPSWCPEWQSSSRRLLCPGGHADHGAKWPPHIDGNTLYVRGISCDTVVVCNGLTAPVLPCWTELMMDILGCQTQEHTLKVLSRTTYPTMETYMKASLHILMAFIRAGRRQTGIWDPTQKFAYARRGQPAYTGSSEIRAIEEAILSRLWTSQLRDCETFVSTPTDGDCLTTQPADRHTADVQRRVNELEGYNIFLTTAGHIGVTTSQLMEGDTVAVLYGCSMPCILREDEHATWQFICCAYIHGLMNGEAVNLVHGGQLVEQDFEIK